MLQQLGEAGSTRAETMLIRVGFLMRFEEFVDIFCKYFFKVFLLNLMLGLQYGSSWEGSWSHPCVSV